MGQTTKSAQEWGDLVRAAYPGYMGPRPRVQLWHGDRDETLNFHNFGEAIKQWTNVLGVSEQPTTTERDAPQRGFTRTRYADGAGVARVEAILEAGMTHNLTVPAAEVVRFFGLDGKADPGGEANADAGTMVAVDAGRDSGNDGGAAPRDGGADASRPSAPMATGQDAGGRGDAGVTVDPGQGAPRADAGSTSGLPIASADAGTPNPASDDDDADAEDDGGCSAAPGSAGTGSGPSLFALGALLALGRRRRRAAVPHG
jgi:MYXO-CTERM domain-containing protein